MKDTKECIMCFSEIDARAKKCPKCRSLQAKYSNLENNPLLIVLLALFIIVSFGFLGYENIYLRVMENDSIKKLKISVTELSTSQEGDTLYVACLGSIDNKTKSKFKEAKFEVNFFSDDGESIDTFAVKDKEIQILANGVTNFRVRGVAQKAKELYKTCRVKIVDASAL